VTRCFCFMLTADVLAAAAAIAASSPSDFQSMASIHGDFAPNTPVCVPLSREVIAGARRDFADVRVFDDQGREIPYVIYKQTEAHRKPESFVFTTVAYLTGEDSEEIMVKRPDNAPPFREIELVIAGNDFKKRVRVEAGSALDATLLLTTDTIFDFSSRLDLRKTTVTMPETDADFLKIIFEDESAPQPENPAMGLRYDGLEFWTTGTKTGPFRINRILAWVGDEKPAEHCFDRITISEPKITTDEDGNSIIYIDGRVPVASLTFNVDNPYYYRRVQLLTADENRDELYYLGATGIIYKIPGMADSENTIQFDRSTCYVRVKVLNEDNPPLQVRSIDIAWIRRNLYFVPESGRDYVLHVGSDVVASPRYELGHLIPSDHARLKRFASMSLSALESNPSYDPRLKLTTREAVERAVFVGVVVILVCALAFWAFSLLKRMPPQTSE